MSVQMTQKMQTLSPQPSLGTAGVPERVATVSILTRSIIFEAHKDNVGVLKIADSEAKASTTNAHSLAAEASYKVSVDNFGNVDAFLDINDFWFDGDTASDKLVVSYIVDVILPEK